MAQYTHDFLNSVFDVEHTIVFSELIPFNLGEIEQVLNYKVHELGRVLLDFLALLQLLQDAQALFEHFTLLKIRAH